MKYFRAKQKCVWLHSSTDKDGHLGKPNYCKNCDGYNSECQMYCASSYLDDIFSFDNVKKMLGYKEV